MRELTDTIKSFSLKGARNEFDARPNQRLVRVEMRLDNDALAAIVNGINADNDATFEF